MSSHGRTRPIRSGIAAHPYLLPALVSCLVAVTAHASVLSTTDPGAIAAFKAGRVVLTFDELTVPAGPCYVPLDPNQYAAQGIIIRAKADGSLQTHLARLPGCGDFGPTLTPPNIIGGGTGPGSLAWRETIRFDFATPADAIGANSDGTGSNTTLTAYRSDGSMIASVTGNEGYFMGIAEPGIAYAVWNWNYDGSVAGFSLDNVTFSLATAGAPAPDQHGSVTVAPSPFRTETWIRWSSPLPGRVQVSVLDVTGRRVALLVDEQRAAGDGAVTWRATGDAEARLTPGLYFVRVDMPGQSVIRRAAILR